MPKAYLCHSSEDKKTYVDIVAKKLGYQKCIYDAISFEEGMKSLEEIDRGLDKTDVFVILLSNAALESKWVKIEMKKAKDLYGEQVIKRIYPIIIDSKITYRDPRISNWLRDEYNLKLVSRPIVAARKINQRLREISWDYHPRLRERIKIFVGRNDLIKKFEERIHSLDLPTPTCIIASGIDNIGRKAFLKHSLKKTQNIDESYEPPRIKLNVDESIEDFIFKIFDLGFSKSSDLKNLMKKKPEEKTEIAIQLLKDIQKAKDILFINDTGCIVTPERNLNKWFKNILNYLKKSERITMCLASSFRLLEYNVRNITNLFNLNVPELDKIERIGLLKQYSEFEGLNLKKDDLKYFSNLLSGYPEQIFYTATLIEDLGLVKAKSDTYLIVDFNKEKAQRLLLEYEDDNIALSFLYLLSCFDFISYDFIFEIVGEDKYYLNLLNEFLSKAICESLGVNNEYVRLNDTIRDHISRIKHKLKSEYEERLEKHVKKFVRAYNPEEIDVSDFVYSMKAALLSGKKIDEKYLIPSHFLKTIKDLYEIHRNFNDVITLAYRVLQNKRYMDDSIVRQIQYYLCLSLARKNDPRFLIEVQNLHGADHNFLLGFYYRLRGKHNDALERLKRALDERPKFQSALRELVQVYLNIEDFESAHELARENFYNNKNNPYHIQAYLSCVMYDEKNPENEAIVLNLLHRLQTIDSAKAREMSLIYNAQYKAFYVDDEESSIKSIIQAIEEFPGSKYAQFIKFEICEKFNRKEDMERVIGDLENKLKNDPSFFSALLRCKAIYWTKIGNLKEAKKFIEKIRNYPPHALEKFIKRIEEIYSQRMS